MKQKRKEKQEAMLAKMTAVYQSVLTKLALTSDDKVTRTHVTQLTLGQCKAVAFL